MTEEHRCTSNGDTPCASRVWQGTVEVTENVRLACDTYRVRFACPELARRVVPGQFVMLRLSGMNDPLLGRPLAVYDVLLEDGKPWGLDVVYLTVGKMTRRMAKVEPGRPLDVWGPLGNGFPPTETEHLIMVAGGIGQTPMLSLAKEYLGRQSFGDPVRTVPKAKKVTLCYGGRTKDFLAGVEDFERVGIDVQLATDDGTAGHHGFVTELIAPTVERSQWPCRIVCCGPEKMMEATAGIAKDLGLPCQVSLETPMACGIGICFSCVAKILDDDGTWDYRRTCVDGPVFDAAKVEF